MTTKIDGTLGVDLIKDGTVKAADFDPSLFLASLGGSGYQKLPSGLIIQWGIITSDSGSNGNITYPIAFPSGLANVIVAMPYASNDTFWSVSDGGNATSCQIISRFVINAGGTGSGKLARWIAIGY